MAHLSRSILAAVAVVSVALVAASPGCPSPGGGSCEVPSSGSVLLQRRQIHTPEVFVATDAEELEEEREETSEAVGGSCCSWSGSCGSDTWCNAARSNCDRCSGTWMQAPCCQWNNVCGNDKWCNAKSSNCDQCRGTWGKPSGEQGGDGGDDEWPTAKEAVKKMGLGINFGQKFDDKANGYWRNDYKSWIDGVKAAGFTHVRIPVTWGDHMWARGDQVTRVKDAVQHALSKGLWVMINTHHEFWLKDHYDDQKWLNDKFWSLWTDIAKLFKDSSSQLVFEVLNEPEHNFGSWNGGHRKPGDARGKYLTKKINTLGLDAIRKISPKRVVFISPNAQGNANQLRNIYGKKWDLPHGGIDKYLGMSVHTYDPWECCGQDGNNGECWKAPSVNFGDIENWSKETGIPVHWGEFGIGRRHNQDSRNDQVVKDYYWKVVAETMKRGQSPCVWDDSGWFAISYGPWNWAHGLKDVMMDAARKYR